MIDFLISAYGLMVRLGNRLQSPILLLIRVYWGWQLIQTGWGKLLDIKKVVQFFTQLGIPIPAINAYFVSGIEFGGGILLVLGLASRPTALVLAINMIVAYVTADREALQSLFSDPSKFYGAAPYTFLFASILILIFGPGEYSLDCVFLKRWRPGFNDRRHGGAHRNVDSLNLESRDIT